MSTGSIMIKRHAETGASRRSAAARLAAAGLLVLHAVLGIAVAIADGLPAAGHGLPGADLVSVVTDGATAPQWLDTTHDCPFCEYLSSPTTASPSIPAATAPGQTSEVRTVEHASPVVTHRPLLPPSRAPPVL